MATINTKTNRTLKNFMENIGKTLFRNKTKTTLHQKKKRKTINKAKTNEMKKVQIKANLNKMLYGFF